MAADAANTQRRWAILAVVGSIVLAVVACGGYAAWNYAINRNLRAVVPGQVYRAGQPDPDLLRQWCKQYGIRTVINLRGPDSQEAPEERRIAGELGADFYLLGLDANRRPTREQLLEVIGILRTARQPILLHCRDGIDRSGAVGAIAAMMIGGKDYRTAVGNLDWWFWRPHGGRNIRWVFDEYDKYCRGDDDCHRGPIDPGGWPEFSHWLQHDYDPKTP